MRWMCALNSSPALWHVVFGVFRCSHTNTHCTMSITLSSSFGCVVRVFLCWLDSVHTVFTFNSLRLMCINPEYLMCLCGWVFRFYVNHHSDTNIKAQARAGPRIITNSDYRKTYSEHHPHHHHPLICVYVFTHTRNLNQKHTQTHSFRNLRHDLRTHAFRFAFTEYICLHTRHDNVSEKSARPTRSAANVQLNVQLACNTQHESRAASQRAEGFFFTVPE